MGSRRTRWSTASLTAFAILLALGGVAPQAHGSAASPGELYAFGYNQHGELGNEANLNQEPNPTPAPVSLPGQLGPVTQAAAGANFSLAVTSAGQLYTFGANAYGQLGDEANLGNILAANPLPTLVSLPGQDKPVTDVAAGQADSLAVTASGQLYAFGYNWFGQLGDTTNYRTAEPNPTPTLVTLPGANGPVTKVAAGNFHSLALTSTGQLYAFGDGDAGQLGTATPDAWGDNPTPVLVTLPGATGPVTQIAAGAFFSLALTSTGQMYAFGENCYGQLGNTINNQTLKPNPTPVQVSLPGASASVVQIAAGQDHSLALTATGQLYAFGENRFGQLGNTTNNATEAPNPGPTPVILPGASGHIIRIAAGQDYSLALTSTGQLYSFGEDYFGQIGAPPSKERGMPHPTPTHAALPSANVETIGTGPSSDHTLAVIADLAVAGSSLPVGEVGAPYSAQAQGTGGVPPYLWGDSGLPQGLSINPNSGVISGTPTAAGAFTLTLTDSQGIETPTPLIIKSSQPNEPEPPLSSRTPSSPTETPSPSPVIETPPPSLPQAPLPSLAKNSAPSPSIINARQSARRWREGRHSRYTRTPTGTAFSFALNEQATASFTFTRIPPHGRNCQGGAHEHPKRESCTAAVATFSVAGHRGMNELAFAGRISHANELAPGRYKLTITATNSTGQRSVPALLSFTIVR